MRVKVVGSSARQNVELFLGILRHTKERNLAERIRQGKFFKALVDRKTGRFFIEGFSDEVSLQEKKEWKVIDLHCAYHEEQGEICFLVEGGEAEREVFHWDDLSPEAYATMLETVKTLNEISKRLKGPSDFKTKLAVIEKLHVEEQESSKDKNILLETWHLADRFQAETLLWDMPIGTYFFRKDPYAEILEEQLQLQHEKKVKCFTLTYSLPDRKFSDLTIVHCDGSWLVYNDDPSLNEPRFSEIQDLLGKMQDFLKYPLYRHG